MYIAIRILRKSTLILHTVTHKPTLQVYNIQSTLNPNSNAMLPDGLEYSLSATRDIAQQYSSASIVSLRSNCPNHKIGVGRKSVIIIIWF